MQMKLDELGRKSIALLLAFGLCGAPQILAAQQSATSQTANPADAAQSNPPVTDPSQAPLEPVPPSQNTGEQPVEQNAPNAATTPPAPQTATPEAPQPQNSVQQPPQKQNQPQGTAAAQKGQTAGGAASQPAGTAIAPAKQKQNRSLLIKIGLIGAAAVAGGTVYALSRKTPSLPPGTSTTQAVKAASGH